MEGKQNEKKVSRFLLETCSGEGEFRLRGNYYLFNGHAVIQVGLAHCTQIIQQYSNLNSLSFTFSLSPTHS